MARLEVIDDGRKNKFDFDEQAALVTCGRQDRKRRWRELNHSTVLIARKLFDSGGRVAKLWAEGLGWREIVKRLGIGATTARQDLSRSERSPKPVS